MQRFRSREETCYMCHCKRSITVNVDTGHVFTGDIPQQCIKSMMDCMTELRDKALLPAEFQQGKVRRR